MEISISFAYDVVIDYFSVPFVDLEGTLNYLNRIEYPPFRKMLHTHSNYDVSREFFIKNYKEILDKLDRRHFLDYHYIGYIIFIFGDPTLFNYYLKKCREIGVKFFISGFGVGRMETLLSDIEYFNKLELYSTDFIDLEKSIASRLLHGQEAIWFIMKSIHSPTFKIGENAINQFFSKTYYHTVISVYVKIRSDNRVTKYLKRNSGFGEVMNKNFNSELNVIYSTLQILDYKEKLREAMEVSPSPELEEKISQLLEQENENYPHFILRSILLENTLLEYRKFSQI